MRALPLALLFAAACSDRTDLLATQDGGTCASPGTPIVLGAEAPCSGALAAKLLRYALCSCSALVLDRGLFTEGGSGKPPMRAPQNAAPAAVGTDDYLQVAGPVQVAGVLEAAGTTGASFSRTAGVLGTLRSAGPLRANQFLAVGNDAFVDGDVLGRVDIGGTLHAPDDADIAASVSTGDLVREPVQVAPPCGCDAGPHLDIAGLLATRATINDDAGIGLAPGALANGEGPTALDLPCGEYYLTTLVGGDDAELELRVHGRVALFVNGDVTLPRGLRVTLDADAELDLIVGGDLTAPDGVIGAPMSESVRLWLASTTVRLGFGASLSAAVYAPNAVVLSDGDLSVRGALFAQSLSVPGDVSVHFDADLLSGGASCGAPAEAAVQ